MEVYSPSFDYLYNIRSFLQMQIVKKYVGESMLTLVIAASDDAAFYLQKNGWIVDDEPFIIKHIQQTLTEITITAYGGHRLLAQRITIPATGQYAIAQVGSADAVVKHFINESLRGLPLATADVQGGTSISDQSRLKPLGDEVARVLMGSGRGEKYTMDAENKQIIFDTYLGRDLSLENAFDNPPVVFDLKYKNISEYTYIEDANAEQTTVYVGGQGEGVDREIIVAGDTETGLGRVEVFVDARDVGQGEETTLQERAAQTTVPTAYTVTAGAVANANLVYGVDYRLGDIVTTNVPVKQYEKVGDYYNPIETKIQVNQRITEVTITREGGAEHIDLRFGEQPISQTQVQQIKAEVAQLKAGGSGLTESWRDVRWNHGNAADLDVATKSGLYYFTPDTLNLPVLDWGTCFVFVGAGADYTGGQYLNQIATSAQYGTAFLRQKTGSSPFTAWKRFVFKDDFLGLIWQGSWASGVITVPNLLNFNLYYVRFAGSDYGGFFVRGNGYITGGVIANPGTPQIYHITMTHSGNDVTLGAAQSVMYPIGSGSILGGALTISAIYGVI